MAITSVTDFGDSKYCVIVDHDPTSTVTAVPAGSLILYNNQFYQKFQDTGTPANDVAMFVDDISTDLISATVERIRETGGPTTLTVGSITDGAALVRSGTSIIGGAPSFFGTGFEQASSDGVSTTTSLTYVNKLTHTTASLVAGTYRCGGMSEISNQNKNASVGTRFTVNGTTAAEILYSPPNTLQYMGHCAFYYLVLASPGTVTLNIDFLATGNTASIQRARVEIWRVG